MQVNFMKRLFIAEMLSPGGDEKEEEKGGGMALLSFIMPNGSTDKNTITYTKY